MSGSVDGVGRLGGRGAIRSRADELDRADEQVEITYAGRPTTDAQWLAATQVLHAAFARWWQPIEATASTIREGDSASIDEALDLLEEDPWCFSSGHAKELLLRRIGGRTLTTAQAERLAGVAKSWVAGRPRREFRGMCRIAPRQIPQVREWALGRLTAGEARERLHALWLVTAFPLTHLTEAETGLLQTSLVEFAGGDPDSWRHGDWLERVARAVVTDQWQEELQHEALDAGAPGLAQLRLLARLPALSLMAQRRRRLHDLILAEAERPTESIRFSFESLAWLSADDYLLAGADRLMQRHDPAVVMHAQWIKRQVLLAKGRPWP